MWGLKLKPPKPGPAWTAVPGKGSQMVGFHVCLLNGSMWSGFQLSPLAARTEGTFDGGLKAFSTA